MRMRVKKELTNMEVDMADNRRCNNETLLSYFPKFLQVQYVFSFYNYLNFYQ